MTVSRSARVQRTTKESDVLIELELDGVSGKEFTESHGVL